MDTINTLVEIVQREVEAYAAAGWQTQDYIISDPMRQTFSVIAVPDAQRKDLKHPIIVVMAHIEGDQVVIDEDNTDRPLSLALQEAGIPRDKIVLAHLGKTRSEPITP
jgi:hypothetical protein